ncbi:MAG: hypothetical protein WCV82_03565 [Candidatus Paceibacterota bacterium]
MDTLNAIFGSLTKVKILRLFLFNPETPFLLSEIAYRTQVPSSAVKKELIHLVSADILRKRVVLKRVETKSRDKLSVKKARGSGYFLNMKFPHLEPLKNLLTVSSISADESLVKRFSHVGKLKLMIVAGVFIQNWDSRVDLLLVGEGLNLHKVEHVIRGLEAEIGKEISYSSFETQDFEYRMGIHDRLVRDIVDGPHTTLLDRLGIEPQ